MVPNCPTFPAKWDRCNTGLTGGSGPRPLPLKQLMPVVSGRRCLDRRSFRVYRSACLKNLSRWVADMSAAWVWCNAAPRSGCVRSAEGSRYCIESASSCDRRRGEPHRHSAVLRTRRGQRVTAGGALSLSGRVGDRVEGRGGKRRSGPVAWRERPEQLRAGVEANLESLGLEQIPVVNLRRHPESDVLFTEQLDAMEAMRQEGLIGRIGLSNVDLEQYRTAQSLIDIACVQNPYNLADTSGEDVFDACRSDGVPFVPFFPLGSAFNPEKPVLRAVSVEERLIDWVQRQLKLRSPGYSSRPQPYCSSPELRRYSIWRRILPLQIWCSTKKHLKCSRKGRVQAANRIPANWDTRSGCRKDQAGDRETRPTHPTAFDRSRPLAGY